MLQRNVVVNYSTPISPGNTATSELIGDVVIDCSTIMSLENTSTDWEQELKKRGCSSKP